VLLMGAAGATGLAQRRLLEALALLEREEPGILPELARRMKSRGTEQFGAAGSWPQIAIAAIYTHLGDLALAVASDLSEGEGARHGRS
jgi:hypothetical protein